MLILASKGAATFITCLMNGIRTVKEILKEESTDDIWIWDSIIKAKTINIMYGIGGRDVKVEDIKGIYETLKDIAKTGDRGDIYRYMGLRDKEAK